MHFFFKIILVWKGQKSVYIRMHKLHVNGYVLSFYTVYVYMQPNNVLVIILISIQYWLEWNVKEITLYKIFNLNKDRLFTVQDYADAMHF